ncbi:MAG: hypothetical protein QMD36_01760 [Candidatus Aenigmarchaeota archaeon]|nr:hypothetical protein [Candidatus Aenigmarchaeota archaeon]
MRFLDVMLLVLAIIGISIILLSVWIVVSIHAEDMENILFKFNLLTFFVGLSYLMFVLVILILVKEK